MTMHEKIGLTYVHINFDHSSRLRRFTIYSFNITYQGEFTTAICNDGLLSTIYRILYLI